MNGKLAVGLACAGVLAVWSYGAAQKNAGRREARAEQAAAVVETLTVRLATVDTVYRERVRTLTRTLTAYDTARVTDTVAVKQFDTTVVYVQRATADSAVNACRRLVFACDARVAASDSLVAALRGEVAAVRAARPNPWPSRGLWALTGAVVCAVACR